MSNLVTFILNNLFYTIISMVIMPLLFLKMYCGLFLLNSFPKFIKDSRSIVDIFIIHFLKVQKSMGDRYIKRLKKYIRKMYSPNTHSHFFSLKKLVVTFDVWLVALSLWNSTDWVISVSDIMWSQYFSPISLIHMTFKTSDNY